MKSKKDSGVDRPVQFPSRDGTPLHGAVRPARGPSTAAAAAAGALLVHGLTGGMNEHGLYEDLAGRLAANGVQSLRFDWRGHGRTGGAYEDVTMSGVVADIGAAYGYLAQGLPRGAPAFVVGSSFGAGMSVCWAAATARGAETGGPDARPRRSADPPARPARVHSWQRGTGRPLRRSADPLARPAPLAGLVLFSALFDCRKRLLTTKPYWGPSGPSREAVAALWCRGWLGHDGGFRIGRGLYNELTVVRPQDRAADVDVPLLAVHGDADSVAPYDVSRACTSTARDSEFATIKGADHGFVHPDDDGAKDSGTHPDTRRFRHAALGKAVSWMAARS